MLVFARIINPAALIGLGFFLGFYLGYRTGQEQARYERSREVARGHDWMSRAEPDVEDGKFSVVTEEEH